MNRNRAQACAASSTMSIRLDVAAKKKLIGNCLAGLLVLGLWQLTARAEDHSLPNFDRRLALVKPAVQVADTAKQAAAASVRSRVGGVKIDYNAILGSPQFVASTSAFLTGTNGAGGAVSQATANLFSPDEPHRGIKTFLTENKALFGFGPEALAAAAVKRDYVGASAGFSTTVWQQQLDNIDIFEAIFKAHLTRNGELINVGSQFVPNLADAAGRIANRSSLVAHPLISERQAIVLAAENVGETLSTNQVAAQDSPRGADKFQHFRGWPVLNNTSTRLTWLPVDAQTLRLCWNVNLESRARGELYQVLVDAQTGEIWLRHCLTDYISNVQMSVWTGESPAPMAPALAAVSSYQAPMVPEALVTLPALDTNASPNGWINDGDNTTIGNNVDAHTDWDNDNVADPGSRPVGSPFRVLNEPIDLTQQPFVNSNAMVVSLFYWNNWAHDKFYEYGFTESAGNFQTTNFNRGGVAGDPVQADAQDSYALFATNSTRNNANFSTPADGSSPRMQMYIFNWPSPARDGDLDASVMVHEYTHGVSGRLVGGGALITALQTKGMGEGWSDFCALSLLSNPTNDPEANYTIGSYVTYNLSGLTNNYYFGIRRYPYSVNTNINPLTFKDIDTNQISSHSGVPLSPIDPFKPVNANEVHAQGEVWCAMLWEARSRVCHKYGNASGNQLMLQLVINGMILGPANPTFLQARDAILQADLAGTGGANQDLLWAAFAKRGMGLSASSPPNYTTTGLVEAFDTPADTNAPVLSVTAPANGAAVQTLVQIGGTAYDGGSGLQGNQIYFTLYNGGNFWSGSYWTNTSANDPSILLTAPVVNGAWTFTNVPTGPNQLQGTYFLSAFARDNAGNVSQAQSGVTSTSFIVDSAPPTLAISFPADGSTISTLLSGNWFQGTASASLVGNNLTVSLFIRRDSDSLYWTGSSWGDVSNSLITSSYDSNAGTWQNSGTLPQPGGALANGVYHFIAIARDVVGNQQQVESLVTVDYHPIFVFDYGSQTSPTPNNRWDDPANWDLGMTPSSDAIVIVNGYSTDNTSLGNFNLYRLDQIGGALTTAGMVVQKLNGTNATLTGTASLATNGVANWAGGQLSGAFTVLAGAAFNFTNDADHNLPNCNFSNFGTVTWHGGALHGGGGSGTQINNYGIWDAQCDTVVNNAFGYSGTVFNNYGSFRKSIGATTNQTSFPDVFFNQYGGMLDMQQGILSLQAGANFSGGFAVTNATGRTILASGNFNINGTVTSSNVIQAGGRLIGNNVIAGALTWTAGTWNATVTLATNSTLYLAGGANLDMPSTIFTNNGVVRWSSGLLQGGGGDPGTQIFNNGLWDAQCDATLNNSFGYSGTVFNNSGTLQKSAGSSTNQTLFDTGVWYNQLAGVVDVQHGSLILRSGANFSGGFVTTNSTGMTILASGNYNINGTVTSSNVVQAGGRLVGNNVIAGELTWTVGSWNATVTLATNSTLYLAGGANLDMPSTIFTNNGVVRWSSGLLQGGGGDPGTQIFNNGLWDAQCDATLNNAFGYSGTVFNNSGTLQKSAGSSTNQTLFDTGVWYNQLAGVVDVQHGSFILRSGANFSGGFVTTNSTGTTVFAAGGFNLNGATTSSNVVQNGGALVGNNLIQGALTWLAGVWNGSVVTVSSNSTVYLAGATNLDLASVIWTNNGTVLWTAGWIQGGGVGPGLLIVNNGLWDIRGDLTLNNGFGYSGTWFNNLGTLRKSVGNGGAFQTLFAGGVFLNQLAGVLDVQQGTLSLQSGANFSGGFVTTNTTGTTSLAAGGFNFSGAITSSNVVETGGALVGNNLIQGALTWLAGAWNSATVTITTNSTLYLAGPANLDLNTTTITNNGVVRWSSGLLQGGGGGTQVFNYGLWDAQGDATLNNAFGYNGTVFNNFGRLQKTLGLATNQTLFASGVFFNQLAGLVDVQQGNFSLQGGANLTGGAFTTNATGTTSLASGGFNFNGSVTSSNVVQNGGALIGNNVIRGALTWLAGDWSNTADLITTNSTLYLAGSANFNLNGTIITNNGTVLWTGALIQGGGGGAGTQIINNGLWDICGDLMWNNTFGYSGTTINNFGLLRKELSTGTTTFTGGVYLNQAGTLDLRSGTLAIAGWGIAGSALTEIPIAGPNAGTQFGNESFAVPAAFAGTLAVSLTNNFTPTNGMSFVLATYPSFSGQFSDQQLPPLPANSHWQLLYNPTSLVLHVVPATAFQSAAVANNGNFQFVFAGVSGSSCVIETSTNLLDWAPLFTNAPFNGSLTFEDPQTSQFGQRYYRATVYP